MNNICRCYSCKHYQRAGLNCGQFWLKDAEFHFLLIVDHFGVWSQVWPRLCIGLTGREMVSRCINEPEYELMCACVCVCSPTKGWVYGDVK